MAPALFGNGSPCACGRRQRFAEGSGATRGHRFAEHALLRAACKASRVSQATRFPRISILFFAVCLAGSLTAVKSV
jgi:hypothetical protein